MPSSWDEIRQKKAIRFPHEWVDEQSEDAEAVSH